MLTVQNVRSQPVLPAFLRLIGPGRAVRLRKAADKIRRRLDGGILWHINSTPAGGGVAEMLQTLLPVYHELGIDARWAVIGGDDDFFAITKRLGLALYGSDGDDGPLGAFERRRYLRSLEPVADALLAAVGPRDSVILHDHQTAGLVPQLAGRVDGVYWRCHVGVDAPTAVSERGWDFIAPLLDACDSLIFSVPGHVPARLADRPVTILPPFISPFSHKNRALSDGITKAALASCGLDGEIPAHMPVQVVADGPREPDLPLITQVSRWDRLKDMTGVLDAVTAYVPDAHLALVGPDPAAITDDIEQHLWYTQCLERWKDLPLTRRRRVSLICLPMTDPAQNATLVNAAQRASDVVVQKSLAEGFGLTVAEAMWKRRVVVGSAVGGIRTQITDGDDGYLLADPADLAGLGQIIRAALRDERRSIEIGARAHDRVHRDFLADREVITTATMITPERVTV